jgi:hypothetical protein
MIHGQKQMLATAFAIAGLLSRSRHLHGIDQTSAPRHGDAGMDGKLFLVKRGYQPAEGDHSLENLDFQASQAGTVRFRQMAHDPALNFLIGHFQCGGKIHRHGGQTPL